MQNVSTREIAEAGLMTAIMVILGLGASYIPVLGTFISFLFPVPLIILSIRHSLKTGVMALIVAGIILILFTEPLYGIGFSTSFGSIGLVFGYMIKGGKSPNHTVLWGALAFLCGVVLVAFLSFIIMGINTFELYFKMYEESFPTVIEMYKRLGLSTDQLEALSKNWQEIMKFIKQALPSMLLVGGVIISFANYWVAYQVLKRIKIEIPPISISNLRLPPITILGFLLAFILTAIGIKDPRSLAYNIGINLQVVFSVLFLLSGLLVVNSWLSKLGLPKVAKVILFIFIIFQPFFSQIVTWIGMFDTIFKFRKTEENT
jgi:uncharacterized protein YybS (DUF2232 family)